MSKREVLFVHEGCHTPPMPRWAGTTQHVGRAAYRRSLSSGCEGGRPRPVAAAFRRASRPGLIAIDQERSNCSSAARTPVSPGLALKE